MLVLVHIGGVPSFGWLLLSIRINTLPLEIGTSLLLAHDLRTRHRFLLVGRTSLLLLFSMLGCAGLSSCPVDISLISASHFILL